MSEENVEIVRRMVEAFNAGGVEGAAEFLAEQAEFREPPEQPAPRVARGRDEAVRMFKEFDEAWTEHRSEIDEVRVVGPDKVLLLGTEHFRGRDGMEITAPSAQIFTIEDGKVVLWQAYWDKESAIAASGSSE